MAAQVWPSRLQETPEQRKARLSARREHERRITPAEAGSPHGTQGEGRTESLDVDGGGYLLRRHCTKRPGSQHSGTEMGRGVMWRRPGKARLGLWDSGTVPLLVASCVLGAYTCIYLGSVLRLSGPMLNSEDVLL